MPVSLNLTLRNNRAQASIDEAGINAKLTVYTAAFASALYTSTCNATAFGTKAGGVLTANAIANATAGAGGIAAIARLFKTDGTTMVMEGLTVGTSGTNIIITNTTIAINDVVPTTSLTITEGNP